MKTLCPKDEKVVEVSKLVKEDLCSYCLASGSCQLKVVEDKEVTIVNEIDKLRKLLVEFDTNNSKCHIMKTTLLKAIDSIDKDIFKLIKD